MAKLIIAMVLLIVGCNQVSGAADIVFDSEKEKPTDSEDGGVDTDTGESDDTDNDADSDNEKDTEKDGDKDN